MRETPGGRGASARGVDATLVTSHSEKEQAAPTFQRGYGHHPMCSLVDHGPDGSGEPLAVLLRPGNAGSNTAADHITVVRAALAQLPEHRPGAGPGRKVLIRTDGAGASHTFLSWLHRQRLSYSVGFGLPANTADLLALLPAEAWTPAYDAHDAIRDGAWVAELTGLLDLAGWPPGMRVIVRKERPHPGAQLRITDADGLRVTAFATNTSRRQLPDLELRHRRRARAEDRIRCAKDTGLTNLPLHGFAHNQLWCAIVAPACELTAWMQMLALTDQPARRWEPNGYRPGCSPSRRPSPAPAADGSCTWPNTTHGPAPSPKRSPGCARYRPDRRRTPADRGPDQPNDPAVPRPVEPAPHPRRPRANRHTQTPRSRNRAHQSASRRPTPVR